MITKDLARRFCSFYNLADAGQIVNVFEDGSIGVGLENKRAWFSVTKGTQQLESTLAAHDLVAAQRESIRRLNELQSA